MVPCPSLHPLFSGKTPRCAELGAPWHLGCVGHCLTSPSPVLTVPLPQAHSVCAMVIAAPCTFGRLRSLTLPPTCVRLLSRNFSKMHCFRICERPAEPGEGLQRGEGREGNAHGGTLRQQPLYPCRGLGGE